MTELTFDTPRLRLIACPGPVAAAAHGGRRRAEALLGLRIHPEWPTADILPFLPIYASRVDREPDYLGWGFWLVVQRAEDMVIGDVGFKGRPTAQGAVDIGYGIVAPYRRQGYASEAARGLRDWAFAQPAVRRLTGDCLPDNVASARILRGLGMREIGTSDAGLLLFEMPNPRLATPEGPP